MKMSVVLVPGLMLCGGAAAAGRGWWLAASS